MESLAILLGVLILGFLQYTHAQEVVTNRVVNGWEVDPAHKYPWIVRIAFNQYPYPGQYCGASLIGSQWILTAAHCSTEQASRYTVEIHRHDLRKTPEQELAQVRSIVAIHTHPDYGRTNGNNNDIALWKMNTSINVGGDVDTVILDAGEHAALGNLVSVIGWGTLEDAFAAPLPDVLQQATVNVADCYSSNYISKMRYNFDPSEMCAGLTDANGTTYDSCSGDSGGPLFDFETGIQTGVVSFGVSCALAGWPGVYSRVGERDNRDFINSFVPNARWSDDGDDPSSEDDPSEDSPSEDDPSSEEDPEEPNQGEMSGEDEDSLCDVVVDGRTGSNSVINGLYKMQGFTNTRPHYVNSLTGFYMYFTQNAWFISDNLGSTTANAMIESSVLAAHDISGIWKIAQSGDWALDPTVVAQCSIPDCGASPLAWIGDGYCDHDFHNVAECFWDGGDCCEDSCVHNIYPCGQNFYNCLDSDIASDGDDGDELCDVVVFGRNGDGSEINGVYVVQAQLSSNGRPTYYFAENDLYLWSGARSFWYIGYTVESVGGALALSRDTDAETAEEVIEPWRIKNLRIWERDESVNAICDGQARAGSGGDDCEVIFPEWLGDGWCDWTYPDYNTEACDYDGGDCCSTTCLADLFPCGVFDYFCLDPNAPEADTCMSHSGFIDGPDVSEFIITENSPDCCAACAEVDGCVGWNFRYSGICQLKSVIFSIVDDVPEDWIYGNFHDQPLSDIFCVYDVIVADISCPFEKYDSVCVAAPRHNFPCPIQDFVFLNVEDSCLFRWALMEDLTEICSDTAISGLQFDLTGIDQGIVQL